MKLKGLVILAAAALMALGASAQPPRHHRQAQPKKEIGMQLYSVRTLLDKGAKFENNLPGLLKELASMGYTHFEAATYDQENGKFYGLTPAELKKAADEAGVKITSSHTGRTLNGDEIKSGDMTEALKWWDKCIADHKAAGMEYIVCPGIFVPGTQAELQKQCDLFNEVGRRCAAQGMKFGYHNHSHEMQKVEDKPMLDYMIEHTDPANVIFEMDVYWAIIGDISPVDYFNRYPGRFKLLHIKDKREIGQSGMVGFDAIFRNADKAGLEKYYVEIEEFTDGELKGSRESADYLRHARFVRPTYAKAK